MAVSGEEGQSLVEFLLLVPLMVGISVLLVRMNTAIQVSLVNQKYARLQAHFLTMNSPYFPRSDIRAKLVAANVNRQTVGVSDDKIDENSNTSPKATEIFVARSPAAAAGADDSSKSPTSRSRVRIRTTVTLCSASHSWGGFPGGEPRSALVMAAASVKGSQAFNLCGGPQDE
ncbi:MAG: hypothetical protein JNL01_04925 [Bdellovibrionales bacterium]|nr:hypothetical protein [Bdellovibrionales bacterium]